MVARSLRRVQQGPRRVVQRRADRDAEPKRPGRVQPAVLRSVDKAHQRARVALEALGLAVRPTNEQMLHARIEANHHGLLAALVAHDVDKARVDDDKRREGEVAEAGLPDDPKKVEDDVSAGYLKHEVAGTARPKEGGRREGIHDDTGLRGTYAEADVAGT